MQTGAWKSYEELEENLTLEELMEIYVGIKENQYENFKNMARANGAKFDEEDEGDPEAFNKVLDQVRERQGKTKKEVPENRLGVFSIKNI